MLFALFEKTFFRGAEPGLTKWRRRSSVSDNNRAGFFRAVSFTQKSRPLAGCNARSEARSFSFVTTATTIRARRSPSCAIDRAAGSIVSISSLRTNCRSSSRRSSRNASCPTGRRKPRGNFRTLFRRAWSKHFAEVAADNVADFCLEMYRHLGLLEGLRVDALGRSGAAASRRGGRRLLRRRDLRKRTRARAEEPRRPPASQGWRFLPETTARRNSMPRKSVRRATRVCAGCNRSSTARITWRARARSNI